MDEKQEPLDLSKKESQTLILSKEKLNFWIGLLGKIRKNELEKIRKNEFDNANSGEQCSSYSQSGNLGAGHMNVDTINNSKFAGILIENLHNNPSVSTQAAQPFTRELKTTVEFKDVKYDGDLVSFELDHFCKEEGKSNGEPVLIKLTILFGEAKEEFLVQERFVGDKSVNVRFGVSRGELYLSFENSSMPLSKREKLESMCWKAEPSGNKCPKWVFKPLAENRILEGHLKNGDLGILNLSTNDSVEAIFKVDVNRQDIAVTFLDDVGTNKKVKETRVGIFLKYIKPKLEDYLSKVKLRYDSAINS